MAHRGAHTRPRRLPLAWLIVALVVVTTVGVSVRAAMQDSGGTLADGSSPSAGVAGERSEPSATPASPSPSLSPAVIRGRLLIHGAGDVNLDPGYIPNLRSFGFAYAWSGLDGLFKKDDLTVVNMECAVSNLGSAVPKQFNFRGDPAGLAAMRKAGVEVANMGNNHSYDYGPQALLDTRRNLADNDIAAVGAGKDPQQALAPALFTIEGWRIAVVGFDKVVDPYPTAVAAEGHPGTAAGHDQDAMAGAVKAAKKVADIVIVDIHWGVELDTQPRADDVSLGHRLIDAGADMIFGGHSHRLQPLETYRGRPIFYSLGNFVWPNFSVAGSTTAVAEVTVTPSGKFSGRLIPAYIESAGHPVMRGS